MIGGRLTQSRSPSFLRCAALGEGRILEMASPINRKHFNTGPRTRKRTRQCTMRWLLVSILAACGALVTGSAMAEVFVLANDGQIRGELLSDPNGPQYVIKTTAGVRITLDRDQVVKVLRQSPGEEEYERIRLQYPDTVAGQWELAEWCRRQELRSVRQKHLQRVVQLDPDHAEARRALGYSRIDGRWLTQAEVMTERGFQLYKGRWRLPQEIELLEQRRKEEAAIREWYGRLNRLREWLGDKRDNRPQQALTQINAINDPFAVRALTEYLQKEPLPKVRMLYLDALGRIGTPAAMNTLVSRSLYDPVEDVRLSALDQLKEIRPPQAVATYIKALRHEENTIVNRAAVALLELQDPSAVGPLIEALVTTHERTIRPGSPGSLSMSFPTGGAGGGPSSGGGAPAGIGVGSKPVVIRKRVPNQSVLDALIGLTNVNFNFEVQAWRYWLASQKKPESQAAAVRRD